jgi:hypothetical protein
MLLALGALVHTLAPVETAPTLRAVLGSLNGEPVLALLIAAAPDLGVSFERGRCSVDRIARGRGRDLSGVVAGGGARRQS